MVNKKSIVFRQGVMIDLLMSHNNELIGLGNVSINKVAMRNSETPMLMRVDTPDGIVYTRLIVKNVLQSEEGARIEMIAVGWPNGRTEYLDEYNQSMINIGLMKEVEDSLTLILSPVSMKLGGREWIGFSYSVEFRSDSRKIHRMLIHGTWEIGEQITGNTVLHQGQCNRPAYCGAKDSAFKTTCLKTLDQFDSLQGASYQLAPRGGLIQGFDFQFASQGALLMFWPQSTSISSLLESPAWSELFHIVDEYRFPLSTYAKTSPKWVLFCHGHLAEHEARDLWWEAHEYIYGGIRTAFGVETTVVLPEVSKSLPTRLHEGRLSVTICGEEVDSKEAPYALADRLLPILAKQHIHRFFPEAMSESDVTQLGMKRKLDGGEHGSFHCSSVCSTHRFRPSEIWGGMKAWKYMADKAHALDIELGAWFAPHLSPRSEIYKEHPEYRMIASNSAADGGGYGFHEIVAADWNTDVYQWVLDDLRRWKDEGGLDYLFVDSWSNMGLLQQNYSAGMRTNFEMLGRLFGDLQKIGIKAFSFEGVSPFGISRFFLSDLRGDHFDAIDGIVGQNDLAWWIGEEDLAFGLCPMVFDNQRTSEDLERILFRMAANRAFASFENQHDNSYELPNWWVRINKIYMQALPYMKTRRLLPDNKGVLWKKNSDESVVWTYRDYDNKVPMIIENKVKVIRIEPDCLLTVDCGNHLKLEPENVYILQKLSK